MAENIKPAWQVKEEHEAEMEELARHIKAERRRMDHELRLAKLKHATQPRYKAAERVLVAFAKSSAWVVLAISLPILVARGKDIPASLTKFMTL